MSEIWCKSIQAFLRYSNFRVGMFYFAQPCTFKASTVVVSINSTHAVRLHWKPKREETTLKRQQHILWFYLVFPIIGPYPVSSSHFGQVALLTFRVRLLQSLRLVHQLHFGTLMIGSVLSTLGIIRSELRYIYCTLVHLTFGTPVGTLSVFLLVHQIDFWHTGIIHDVNCKFWQRFVQCPCSIFLRQCHYNLNIINNNNGNFRHVWYSLYVWYTSCV